MEFPCNRRCLCSHRVRPWPVTMLLAFHWHSLRNFCRHHCAHCVYVILVWALSLACLFAYVAFYSPSAYHTFEKAGFIWPCFICSLLRIVVVSGLSVQVSLQCHIYEAISCQMFQGPAFWPFEWVLLARHPPATIPSTSTSTFHFHLLVGGWAFAWAINTAYDVTG